MYAVILAGGGGTRLHPLSRPERPKPFLPLLGERSLLQGTVDRLSGLTDDITVVTDRRYRDIVLEQAPGVERRRRAARSEHRGGHRARDARHRPTAGRGHGRPAGRPDRPARRTSSATSSRRPPSTSRPASFGVDDPLVTLGIAADRPATEYGYLIPDVARGADVGGLRAYPLTRFEEKPKPARAEQLVRQEGVAWNAGIFLWRRRAITAALARYTGLLQSLGPMAGTPASLERAYEAIQKPVSIDYAVMEGAAQSGQVVMGSMDVGWSDLGSWSALLGALGARGSGRGRPGGRAGRGRARRPGRPAVGGRLGVIAPPERGSMTATQPIAVLRGAGPGPRDRRGAPRALFRTGGNRRDTPRAGARADDDRVRDRRLARPDRRRVHLRQRPALRRRRGRLCRRAGRDGQGRGRRLRPPLLVRVLRDGRRRDPARPRHPGRLRGPRRADPDELVRGRRARLGGRHRHHRQPQPVGRQRLQGQGTDRRRGRGRHPRRHRAPARGQRRDRARPAAVRRRRGGRAGRAVRPVRGLRAVRPADGRPRRAARRRHVDPGRPDVGRRERLAVAPARRRPDPGRRDPPGAQPVLRGRQPRAHPPEHRRGARPAGRRRLRPRPAARRRRGPGGRGRRARHVPPPARGHRAADVLPRRAPGLARPGRRQRQQHLDGGAARRALRDHDPRDAGRVQVHRPEDDRDRAR